MELFIGSVQMKALQMKVVLLRFRVAPVVMVAFMATLAMGVIGGLLQRTPYTKDTVGV